MSKAEVSASVSLNATLILKVLVGLLVSTITRTHHNAHHSVRRRRSAHTSWEDNYKRLPSGIGADTRRQLQQLGLENPFALCIPALDKRDSPRDRMQPHRHYRAPRHRWTAVGTLHATNIPTFPQKIKKLSRRENKTNLLLYQVFREERLPNQFSQIPT